MIRAKWYKELMEYADIPLSKTETSVLDSLTKKNGMVNEEKYMMELLKKSNVFVTNNQRTTMKMLACLEGSMKKMKERNRH